MPKAEPNPTTPSKPSKFSDFRTELEWYCETVHSEDSDTRPIKHVAPTLSGVYDLTRIGDTLEYAVEETTWGHRENPDTKQVYQRTAALVRGLEEVSRETRFFEKDPDTDNPDRIAIAVYSLTDLSEAVVYTHRYSVNGEWQTKTGARFPRKVEETIDEIVGKYTEVETASAWQELE